jgi:hypothetical protein
MNMAIISYAAALLTSGMVTTANPNGPGWQRVTETDGITVWKRDAADSKIREVKAESFIEVPPSRVQQMLQDFETYPEFMPYMLEAKLVGKAGPDADFIYHRVDPPLVDERDYTLKITSHQDPATGVYVREWTRADTGIGPPASKGVVRLELCDGSWTVEPAGANRTHLVYWVYTDPGGAVPSWIANKANTVSMPDIMRAVRKRAIDPTYKK